MRNTARVLNNTTTGIQVLRLVVFVAASAAQALRGALAFLLLRRLLLGLRLSRITNHSVSKHRKDSTR